MKSLRCWCEFAVILLASLPAGAQQIALTIDRIEGPGFSARQVTGVLRMAGTTALDLQIAEVDIAGNNWRNVRMRCPDLRQEPNYLVCAQGTLESPLKTPLTFRYSALTGDLELALLPATGEEWRLTLGSRALARTFTLTVSNGQIARLNAWWPAGWPKGNAGSISGKLSYTSDSIAQASAELAFADFGFGDDSGLHAGEKIAATLSLQAQQRDERWLWQGRLVWKSGDVFWQPLFVGGSGHALDMAGTLDAHRVSIENGRLTLADIGDFDFHGAIERAGGKLVTAALKGANLAIAALYDKLLKPALQGTELADLRTDGHADLALEVKDGAISAVDLKFSRISIEDNNRRFALFGIDGNLPWRRDAATTAQLHVAGGEVLQLPFGAFELPLAMRGIRVRMRDIQIPLLNGKLSVNNFAASGEGDSWRWRFSGLIAPIAMEQFTTTVGLPVMHGTLSAEIPDVVYERSTLKLKGALMFKIFDGTIAAQNLVLENPLGQVARFAADVEMRNLDLELLTRTFSFGNITGRIDADVKALEMVNWEPVHFDARIASSAGEYPRHISQKAVQNISSLGGAGAGAAIQRSFLRFFENFGYSAIGLSCRLEHGVCRMGGVEDVPQGYVIVKGGGIPAINVMGYNRSVGWSELIARLKRVIEDNVKPIVK